MIIVGSGKKTTTYEQAVLREDLNATFEFSDGDGSISAPLYQSYDFVSSSGMFVVYSPTTAVDDLYAGNILYRINGDGTQLYKYTIVTPPSDNRLTTVGNLTTYYVKENTTYEGVELEGFNLGGVDLETIYARKGETGNLVLVWENIKSPKWFNYTGIDANGNYEGTSAYDGTPVAYGIGKPTITTADDGTETISWANANGLNDDYFIEKYGDSYVKEWDVESGEATPLQVVEDMLVIPDTYKGIPVTTVLDYSFYARYYSSSGTIVDERTQAYFYKDVVFGNNITTIRQYAFVLMNMDTFSLGTSVGYMQAGVFGGGTTDSEYNMLPIIQVNSNIVGLNGATGLYNGVKTVIFSENVTEVTDILNISTTYSKRVWVFKQPADTNVTITFNAKSKSAQTVTIYTDNNSVKNYDWSTNGNITPTFYPLSDYTG